jgi:uncharacterized membrane protein YphA (DoxX/SURF4 family)
MEQFFDQLHASARRIPALYRLAIVSRLLLALAFIPTGLVKLLGNRFTLLGTDNPVGAFFEAMYQTGFYWNFLGLGQVTAGILLLIPWTTTLGAVMFLPIVLNITVVTWSIGFQGTVYVTALMLLANVFLICWDYDRLRTVLFAPSHRPILDRPVPVPAIERAGYLVGTGAGLVALMATRSFVPMSVVRWALLVGVVAFVMVLSGWIQAGVRARRGLQTTG